MYLTGSRRGFWIRGLEVRQSGLDLNPYQEKYTFSSITWISLPQIENMRTCLKGLCARKFRATMPWSAAHLDYSLIRPKSQIPNIRHDCIYSIDRKFHADDEKIQES
jgi:hypothetical protein